MVNAAIQYWGALGRKTLQRWQNPQHALVSVIADITLYIQVAEGRRTGPMESMKCFAEPWHNGPPSTSSNDMLRSGIQSSTQLGALNTEDMRFLSTLSNFGTFHDLLSFQNLNPEAAPLFVSEH